MAVVMGTLEEPHLTGRRFGRYEILHRFASGGMADLYLARLSGEEGFERIMALKVIRSHLSAEPEFVKMFIDEARLASRISHPNVALTFDLGLVDGTHFIAMEYVDGESLGSLMRRTAPPIPYVLRIISDAASGLHAAHELCDVTGEPLNVVHRDVSPANILISYDGTVKVVDFGIARVRGSLHTTRNSFKGKFGYMSPEQFSAPLTVDRRTDIFALGVILYEMTTWTRLFRGSTDAETVERVLHGEVPPPTEIVLNYPPALEPIVLRALERSPENRQQTADQLHEELEELIAETGMPIPSSAIGKLMREIFAERIAEKRVLLENSLSHPSLVGPASSVGPALVGSEQAPAAAPTSRRQLVILAVTVVVLVTAVVLLLAGRLLVTEAGRTAPAPDRARGGRDALRLVTVSARALPAEARITLGGTARSNPFEAQLGASEGSAELVISAPGYQTQRFRVSLARGGNWTVALLAEPPPQPLSRPAKKPAAKRPGRHDFLENPYQRRRP